MMRQYVLDACSLIAFFRDENGADAVELLFHQAATKEVTLLLHKIPMVEVLYDRLRMQNGNVHELIWEINRLPIMIFDTLDNEFIAIAALYKASHKISF